VANGVATLCRDALDECYKQYDEEIDRCSRWRNRGPKGDTDRWYRACKVRAADRRGLCEKNKGTLPPDAPPEYSENDIPKDTPGAPRPGVPDPDRDKPRPVRERPIR
jgi:hypothetical protein